VTTPSSGSGSDTQRHGSVGGEAYGPGMTDVDTRISNLKEDVRLIGVSTAEALSRLDKIQNTLSAHSAKLVQHDSRLGEIDARLGQIDARLDGHDRRFDQIDARLDGHDRRFDQIDARLDGHDRRFDHIDTQLAAILSRLPQAPQ
jgi:chromosome segregation ATPase